MGNNQIKTPYLQTILTKLKCLNLSGKDLINALNGIDNGITEQQQKAIKQIMPELVKERYNFIDNLLEDCLEIKENYVFGYAKLDKIILNPLVMLLGFLSFFFVSSLIFSK